MYLVKFVFPLFIIFAVACNSSGPATPTQKLHDDIMFVHDDVMPKTAEIRRMVKRIKLKRKDITANNTSLLKLLDQQVNNLNKADDDMMDWMADYKKPSFQDTTENTMNYLRNQKDQIDMVKLQIEKSLSESGRIMENIKG